MSAELVCWKCGASTDDWPLPLSRRAECPECEAELHVCKMCQFYDPRVSDQCTEDRAEEVREKERANFCDYFKPKPNAYVQRDDSKAQAAKAELDGLFDAGSQNTDTSPQDDQARQELEQLFRSGKKKKD